MSGMDEQKPSEEQMLAWLALEGYQAYAGSVCVGVHKDGNAWWVDTDATCGRGRYAVIDHPIDVASWTRYPESWLGGIYDKPIHELHRLWEYLSEQK